MTLAVCPVKGGDYFVGPFSLPGRDFHFSIFALFPWSHEEAHVQLSEAILSSGHGRICTHQEVPVVPICIA